MIGSRAIHAEGNVRLPTRTRESTFGSTTAMHCGIDANGEAARRFLSFAIDAVEIPI